MVELGVVEAVQQMDRARPGGGQAHTEPAGRLGVAGGHEGGGLLVVDEDEADSVLSPQTLHDPVDAVAGQPEDGVDAPIGQPLDEHFRRRSSTLCLLRSAAWVSRSSNRYPRARALQSLQLGASAVSPCRVRA